MTGSGVLVELARGGRMVTASIVAGSGVLVTAGNVAPDVTTGNEFTIELEPRQWHGLTPMQQTGYHHL